MRLLVSLSLLLIGGYLLLCAAVYLNQDRMLFFPTVAPGRELENYAEQLGLGPWTNARGERIGWKSPDRGEKDALLVCHGNGGFALGRNYTGMRRDSAAPLQFHLLEYPGYGARPGKVSTQSLTDAAIDAIDTLSANSDRRITLMGQSLGSGIASAAVAARPDKIAGLILLTPFDSLAAAAGSHYPWLPARLLLRHRLDSDKNLEKYRGPIAFIVAGDDTTIPPRHAERLYEGYTGPKRLWLVPGAGHNDFDELLAAWPEIAAWLRSAALKN